MPERLVVIDGETNRGRLLQRRLGRLGFAVEVVAEPLELVGPAGLILADLAALCGRGADTIAELARWLTAGQVLRCPTCGRQVREIEPGQGAVSCCGQAMVASPEMTAEVGEEAA